MDPKVLRFFSHEDNSRNIDPLEKNRTKQTNNKIRGHTGSSRALNLFVEREKTFIEN